MTVDTFQTYVDGRFSSIFVTQAIEIYRPFKFVIAFENTVVNGYITEKLTNAFLAGSVPIYYGSPYVGDFFNNQSFINCHDFKSLHECATYVQSVNNNDELYLSYLAASPMVNKAKWCEFFQWQAAVKNDMTCKQYFEIEGLDVDITRSIANRFDIPV